MYNLKDQLINLGEDNKDLRRHIRPVLAELRKEADVFSEFGDFVETMLEQIIYVCKGETPIGVKFSHEGLNEKGILSFRTESSGRGPKTDWWVEITDLKWNPRRESSPSLSYEIHGHPINDREFKKITVRAKASSARWIGSQVANEIRNLYGFKR